MAKKEVAKKEEPKAFAVPKGEVHTIISLETAPLNIFKCPYCSKPHFRHAGYIEVETPYVEDRNPEIKSAMDSKPVKICVACGHSFITHNAKIYDVTNLIDIKAWEKMEVQAHAMTGPGGNC